jgi:hypothetical protein
MSAIRSPAAPGSARLYKKIIRDVLHEVRPDSFAELIGEVKDRCARYRIPYWPEVDRALADMHEDIRRALVRIRP